MIMKKEKIKILITGAAGFIGSHLVDTLLKSYSPSQLRLIALPGDSLDNLRHHGNLEIFYGDIRDENFVIQIMSGIDVVFHLAARIDFDGKTYDEYEDVNVTATRYLLEQSVKQKVKKFIFYSSIGVHGLPAAIGDILGWNELHPPTYTNYYGQSKWEGEQLVRAFHEKYNLPYAIIRPASVYGPREKGPTFALIKAIKSKQYIQIGDGKNVMHYVFVQDLVNATILAYTSKKSAGTYIIAGASPVSLSHLSKEVARFTHSKITKLKLPTSIAYFFAYLAIFVQKILPITLPLYPSRVRTMTTSYYYSIEKAKEEIGYRPHTNIETGIAMTCDWMRSNGHI